MSPDQDRSLGSPGTTQYTKEYEYEYEERPVDDGKHRGKIPGVTGSAFTYEGKDQSGTGSDSVSGLSSPEAYDKSPGLKKARGYAFNYAPGDSDKLKENAERRNKMIQDMARGAGDMTVENSVLARTPAGTPITTPEKDKGFDVEQFVNENKPYQQQQQQQTQHKTPSPTHLYAPRPWSAASSQSGSYIPGDSGTSPRGSSRLQSSIFSQPGYTTSFLNKPVSPIPSNDGLGYQNRSFQESSLEPLSTSTPMARGNGFREQIAGRQGDTISYATPVRPFQPSESMITHPGTITSQVETPQSGPPGRGSRQQKRVHSDSEGSVSEADSLHSSSSEDYTENKVPETSDLNDPLARRVSSKKGKGKKGSNNKGAFVVENKGALSSAPKIVKTTTKQTVVKDAEGMRHDVHERIEDLTPGGSGMVTVSTTSNEVCILLSCDRNVESAFSSVAIFA